MVFKRQTDKPCQTNLISFHNKVTSLVDLANEVDITWHFSKTFDEVLTLSWWTSWWDVD